MASIINIAQSRVQNEAGLDHNGPARRRRQFLMATVLTTGLFTSLGLTTNQAIAANECGALGGGPNTTLTCTGIFTNGVEYSPAAPNEVFTLNAGNGTIPGSATIVAPTVAGFGQFGIVVGNGLVLGIPTSGSPATTIVNVTQFSQVTGTEGGVLVWTSGAGNNSTINNSGTVLATGAGTGIINGSGLMAVADGTGGIATVNNNATGTVNANKDGLVAFSLGGGAANVTNDGLVNTNLGHGISTVDPLGLGIPTTGTATVNQNGTVNAGFNGINALAVGEVIVNLGANSVTNAGATTTGTGVLAISATSNVTVAGDATSAVTSVSGPGIVGISDVLVNGTGTTNVTSGTVSAGGGNVVIAGIPIPLSGGVIAIGGSGGATANTLGSTTLTGPGALFGVAAISLGGASTVTLNGNTVGGNSQFNDTTFGVAAISIGGTGNASINTGGAQVFAANVGLFGLNTGTGQTIINSTDGGNGNSVDSGGIGILGLAGTGGVLIDAGKVISNSPDAGPAQVGGIGGSGVIGASLGGNVNINLHGDVTTNGGTFGALGVSIGGSGTVTSDAGIIVDPPIGMAMVTIGSGLATVNNNGTVNSTVIGLLGVNIGDGAVLINNSTTAQVQAATGDGVFALKLGQGNLANSVDGTNMVVVNNDNVNGNAPGGVINAPNGAGVRVIAFDPTFNLGNNVLVSNTNNASITGEGTILNPGVGVLADGNVQITNNNASTITNANGLGGLAIGAASVGGLGGTTVSSLNVLNDNGSTITGNMLLFATQDTSVVNDNGSNWSFAGLSAVTALRDATITNDRGSTIDVNGLLAMVAGRDTTINNDRGSNFNLVGINANLMIAGRDATINNDRGANFNLIGINANIMLAGRDATINNSRGADFNMLGINGNLMVAGRDAIFTNQTGGDVNMLGLNAVAMIGGNNATFNNTSNATLVMAGVNTILLDGVTGASTFNNTSNDGGNNRVDCAANNLGGICVTGIGTITGGFLGGPLNFNNAGGLLSMIDNNATRFSDNTGIIAPGYGTQIGDITFIGDPFTGRVGNFIGTGNSQIGFDAVLRGPNNSASDVVVISGATAGRTGMIINDLAANSPGQLNLSGIPLIAVTSGNTSKGDFFIDPSSQNYSSKFGGVIDKGLFIYSHQVRDDPFFNPGNGFANQGKDHVLIATPDQELFELGKAAAGAQRVWYESTGVWGERTADLRSLILSRGAGMPAGAGADMPVKAVYKAPPPPVRGITPGVWIKGLASWTDVNANDSFSIVGQTFGFDTSYKQKVFGVIGGVDGGWDYRDSVFMVGLLGGYLDSSLKFNSSGNSFDYSGGTVGGYASYLNGAFYIDTIFKADLLTMKWNANTLSQFGVGAPETDANSYGGQVDMGYRFNYGGAWFWEPLGSIAYLRTTIGDLNVLGQTLHWGDSTSTRGSLGGRVGAVNYWGGMKVEASITGRVWHEFEDPSPFVVNAGQLAINDTFKGTFGDVNGTLNFFGVQTGWSSFVNGGVKWNSDFTTVSAKGGVRYSW